MIGADAITFTWTMGQLGLLILTTLLIGCFIGIALKTRSTVIAPLIRSGLSNFKALTLPAQVSIISSFSAITLLVLYLYFSPYHSCVRGLIDSGMPERIAILRCSQI